MRIDQTVPDTHAIFDIGPESIMNFIRILKPEDHIFFNGAMGKFEIDAFSFGSLSVMAFCTKKKGLVAGGDTLSLLKKIDPEETII